MKDATKMALCGECGFEHIGWISCWGAMKNRYFKETGRDWYDDNPNPWTGKIGKQTTKGERA